MKKVLKIIITTIILAMFFCNASFAAGLGEKEGGAIVVAIYNNNTYIALNVTTEALEKGQVLEWNKWSNEDLVLLHDRSRKTFNKKGKWYSDYKKEFQKRIDNKQIIATGNSSGKTAYSESTEYKPSKTDTSKDDKQQDANDYKNYTPIKIVQHLEEGKEVPENCRVVWDRKLREAVEQMEKNKGSMQYERFKKVYETYFGPYQTSSGTGSQQSGTQTQQSQQSGQQSKTGGSKTTSVINPDDYMPESLDSTTNSEELGKLGNIIIGFIQAIGSIASVAVLGILGIKYMVGSAEERAEYKKSLRPYIIGAVMVFAITNLLGILAPIAKNLFGNI